MNSHLYSGYTVPPYYDSMIGTLIAYGPNRQTAIIKMRNLIQELVINGIKTNISLNNELMNDTEFQKGATSILYLEQTLFAPDKE